MLLRRSKALSPREAHDSASRGELQLVDVREPRELAEASIPGAVNIPLGQLPARIEELDPGRRHAFVCRSGKRSAAATRIAVKAGLDAANVRGGLTAWTVVGLPVTRTAKRNR